jgi:hypothetical protein
MPATQKNLQSRRPVCVKSGQTDRALLRKGLSGGGVLLGLPAMRQVVLCLCLTLALPAYGAVIGIDFSDLSAGSTPTNFFSTAAGDGRPGDWKIVMDDVPPLLAPLTDKAPDVTRRAVLAQTSRSPVDEHFPMFVYNGETFTDFKLTTRFKIISGVVEQMAGVVFRFQNASNFYVLRASALGHNVRFYKVVEGMRTDPIGPQVDVNTNTWHTLTVLAQGNEFSFWFDNRLLMPPLQDNSFSEGRIGFWTKSDAVSCFCDTSITYTPRIPAAQALVDDIMKKQPRILALQIYTLNKQGQPCILASKDKTENGQPGTDSETKTINGGAIFYGKDKGLDTLILPLRDRNGDPMAAVRVQLKSFFGETQQNALTRARMIVNSMQAQAASLEELLR